MATKDKRIEDVDLASIVDSEIANARAYYESEVDGKRSLALEYVHGVMRDVKTLPNRSTMVSRDVADTISWVHPGVIRVFASSDKIVEYSLSRPGDKSWSRDATEFMNYDFLQNNHGYRIIYNATYDALTLDMGVVSSEWIPVEKKRETLKRQTIEQLAMLSEEGVEILAATPLDEMYEAEGTDEFGMPAIVLQPYYDVKINRVVKEGHIKDETLRPENLLVNDTATTIEDARSVGYCYDTMTRSDLMAMADEYGFDKSVIRELPTDGYDSSDGVQLSRTVGQAIDYDSPVRSGDLIKTYRYFVQADVDGDGIAETVQCWYAGQKVLAWEVWEDDIPYTDIPCYPVPHRFNGDSIADRTMDIQRAKTVLLRQTMDNLYASAVPTQEVELGSVLNPDALVQKRFGSIIWKKVGSAPIVWGQTPFFADKSLAAMGYFDEVRAMRTGVSRTTMALDPEALQNQTATAAQQQRDAGYSQIELIARNMAELGFSRFFTKRLKLAVKYQQVAMVPVNESEGEFREVFPSQWQDNMGVTVNVGLGTGSKDRDMAMLNTLLGTQNAMAQQLGQVPGAQAKAIEFIPKIRDTAVKLAESSGIKNPDTYFPPISEDDVKAWQEAASQPQPDPKVQIEQVKSQEKMQQQQQDHEYRMTQIAAQSKADEQEAFLRSQEKIKQIEVNGQIEEAKAIATLDIKRRSLVSELELKEQLGYAEIAMKERLAKAGDETAGGPISNVNVGGEIG